MTKKQATAAMNIIEAEIIFKKDYSDLWPSYDLEEKGEDRYELEITFPFQNEMLITANLFERFSTISITVISGYTIRLS